MFQESDRGVSYLFGETVIEKFLDKYDLDLIARGHQVETDGYAFFADRQVVTLFSAPNYCGEFDNSGAIMSVEEDLTCSFQVLAPADAKKRKGKKGNKNKNFGTNKNFATDERKLKEAASKHKEPRRCSEPNCSWCPNPGRDTNQNA